jgi:hypothetical protein
MHAALELSRDMPAAAIELLQSATVYERAQPQTVYLRGLAYLRLAKKGAAAAATEFQKILDHKGAYFGFGKVIYPASHVGVGACGRHFGRRREDQESLRGFPFFVEGRRPRYPPPNRSPQRISGAPVGCRRL